MSITERVYRVALFGAIGSGKSSIINLLADGQVADISANVEPCTRRTRWYPISLGEKNFRLFDTMGFCSSPIETKDVNPLSPYEQAHALLRNIPNGIDLILLCARKDGIYTSLRRLYWLLDSFFFGGRAQIALVLTHFDAISVSEQLEWWDRKCNYIAERCNIPVGYVSHVCITTVYRGSSETDIFYQRSKQALEALLLEEVVGTTPTPLPLDRTSITEATENLSNYCQLDITDARTLVEKFRSPTCHFNVVLFGESGVGKSSIINLLSGGPVADVCAGVDVVTLNSTLYEIDIGSHQLQVWDTVGFNSAVHGIDMSWEAIENSARLIRRLHDQGGVGLLVFCKKYGRNSPAELGCFKIFHEFLCEGRIPVAFIITHLEFLNPMEQWWEKNEKGLLEAYGLKPNAVAGHACITSLSLEDTAEQTIRAKILHSRWLVQTMLDDAISYGDAFIRDRKVRSWSTKKMTVRNLMERCGLNKENAETLIKVYKIA